MYCSGSHSSAENIGIVKGIPQVRSSSLEVRDYSNSPKKGISRHSSPDISESPSQRIAPPYKDPPAPPPYRDPPPPNTSANKKNVFQVGNKLILFSLNN